MYSITARRMISGLVLKYLKEAGLFMGKSYATPLPASSKVLLTKPNERLRLQSGNVYHRVRILVHIGLQLLRYQQAQKRLQ